MAQNLIEKIVQKYALGLEPDQELQAGDFVRIAPQHVMTHDNSSAVMLKFSQLGAKRVHNPRQPVFHLDHDVQNKSEKNLAKYAAIEAFAKKQGITFFPAGFGIGHQNMIDQGFVLPGTLVVGSDSHSNIYGAMGALGTPVVRTDAAAIWASGETWWQIPDVVRVHLKGQLPKNLSGKDLIVALCGLFNHDEVLNCAVEFSGPACSSLSMEQRMAVSNMSTEWGALAGVFAADDKTQKYLMRRAQILQGQTENNSTLTESQVNDVMKNCPHADEDAFYLREIDFDLDSLSEQVAGPDDVKHMQPVAKLADQRIDRAYLLSCVGGRPEDFAAAARELRGQKVADHVKLYIAAASAEIEQRVRAAGDWQILLDAGAIALPAGCGACIGLGAGLLEAGEVGISATNRNFKGRMGSRDAQVYLASPAVVAASAAAGHVQASSAFAQETAPQELKGSMREQQTTTSTASISMVDGFAAELRARVLWCDQDNLNTDGIYSKDYTYREDLSHEEMAAVAMLNYDPDFQKLAHDGDVLLSGFNFGSGSSREQAATALMYRGIKLVIAASFSQTYKRNALNNGFIVLEAPKLVAWLRARFADNKNATLATDLMLDIDFAKAELKLADQSFSFVPLGAAAQQLIVDGGLENQVCAQLAAQQ